MTSKAIEALERVERKRHHLDDFYFTSEAHQDIQTIRHEVTEKDRVMKLMAEALKFAPIPTGADDKGFIERYLKWRKAFQNESIAEYAKIEGEK